MLSSDTRLIAAFLAAAVALILCASLAISDGRAYVAAEGRIEQLTRATHVLSELSPTAEAAARDVERKSRANGMADPALQLRAERRSAQQHLEATERSGALLGILSIAFFCFAYSMLLRGLRRERWLKEQLRNATNHDPLTGLPNDRFFAEWLSYAIAHARRERAHVGVLFIDIDGCAAVSELHGEQATAALLIEIARRFRAASREGDLFARLGMTQFALATPNARDGRQLALLAQRLRDQLNESAQAPLADTPIGASIGIAFFPEDAQDSAGIMAAANAAMYAARRAGKNHVAFNALAA
jgi:diguanylate cyclase (GGDEF)-like protein